MSLRDNEKRGRSLSTEHVGHFSGRGGQSLVEDCVLVTIVWVMLQPQIIPKPQWLKTKRFMTLATSLLHAGSAPSGTPSGTQLLKASIL